MVEVTSKEPAAQFDAAEFRQTFEARRQIYEALLSEVVFILKDAIEASGIKIHGIESRVKDVQSIIKKCADKEYSDPYVSLVDIAGVRLICLFRSDLEKIGKLLLERFDISTCDDKINQSTDSFGYMSVHYVGKIKSGYSGPRYEKIKGLNFEIQVRTLSMHAWAAISHYLDYKGEWDVPIHLRKSLNALSALFYVADSEFEQFYLERERVRGEISNKAANAIENTEINLDSMREYLRVSFPDRRHVEDAGVSELVKELKGAGYGTISQVSEQVSRARGAFETYEKLPRRFGQPRGTARTRVRYADIGVVRASLSIASDAYLQYRVKSQDGFPNEVVEEFKAMRKLL